MARGSPACSPGFCAGVWSLRCVEETGRPASDSGPQAFAGGGCPLCTLSLFCQDPCQWQAMPTRVTRHGRGAHCRDCGILSRKEVFQPHLPVRLPCYDLAPVTCLTLGRSSRSRTSGTPGFHGLTGGVYKARERIHRAMADARLLANPASRSRVADSDPN